MIARIAKSLTFSNVIACLALFVALGGSVYAANKINGKQIKKSSLPGNRLKAKTVPGNRLKPNSLTGKQINEKTLTGVSAAALANVQYQSVQAELPSGGRAGTVTANCPPGAYAIGGGATLSNEERGAVNSSGPSPLRTGWQATGYSYYAFSRPTMTVTAVCVVVDKPGSAVNPGSPQYQPAG
ncbi:MAG TPA: hypothetical protein VFR75_06465 [Solirubrobacterales bacterium]|nr:hypothetical protein [Solirubrobacterales bacterium]